MSDWQIGDLAVCVGSPGGNGAKVGLMIGRIYRVIDVTFTPRGSRRLWLEGIRHVRGGDANCFRKIRPDEQEACEPEFITLLKRSKVPETASDWLLSVKDLARRLNEQSRRDPREREAGNRLPANQ